MSILSVANSPCWGYPLSMLTEYLLPTLALNPCPGHLLLLALVSLLFQLSPIPERCPQRTALPYGPRSTAAYVHEWPPRRAAIIHGPIHELDQLSKIHQRKDNSYSWISTKNDWWTRKIGKRENRNWLVSLLLIYGHITGCIWNFSVIIVI